MNELLQHFIEHVYLTAATLLVLVLLLVTEFRLAAGSFAAVSPQQAVMLANRGALLLDVRPAEAYAAGHLASARNFPGGAIADGAKQLEKWKDKPVVVYCDTGLTSGSAARHLQRLGFTQVKNLRGGLTAWRADNLPVVKA
jgi:rhodanese-related sulfurtransferase